MMKMINIMMIMVIILMLDDDNVQKSLTSMTFQNFAATNLVGDWKRATITTCSPAEGRRATEPF